jgi:CheY-like chemotaxis protein
MNGIILYVEDEETDRFLMRLAFAIQGLAEALRMVKDGKTAQDYLSGADVYEDRQKHPLPALVLLDLHLPEVNGFDVLQWIRAHPLHSSLPVVVFTSSDRDEDRARARLLGANEFLTKPRSPLRLREFVKQLNQRWLSP